MIECFINAYAQPYTLLPSVMKLKTQIKIHQKLVCEFGRKYDGAEDFINTGVKEFCLEHGILEEIRLYMLLCCVYSLVTNSFKNESFSH